MSVSHRWSAVERRLRVKQSKYYYSEAQLNVSWSTCKAGGGRQESEYWNAGQEEGSVTLGTKNLWLIINDQGENTIRFSFPVFQTKDKVENEDNTINVHTLPTPSSSTYRDTLQSIAKTHVLREFIVFDTTNSRVDPEDIPTKLKPSTLLECYFKVEHYCFGMEDSFIGKLLLLYSSRYPDRSPSCINKSKPQQHLNFFTPQMPVTGPSNVPLPDDPSQKQKASIELEGSDVKPVNMDEDKDKNKESDSNTETSKDDRANTESPHSAK
ncbi:hypothetical protein C8R44DRAFT_737447 [Mycena epipterygia]|nr:hypothetical protein C8R44DRAFT_737447 [Mycena epipterygia]